MGTNPWRQKETIFDIINQVKTIRHENVELERAINKATDLIEETNRLEHEKRKLDKAIKYNMSLLKPAGQAMRLIKTKHKQDIIKIIAEHITMKKNIVKEGEKLENSECPSYYNKKPQKPVRQEYGEVTLKRSREHSTSKQIRGNSQQRVERPRHYNVEQDFATTQKRLNWMNYSEELDRQKKINQDLILELRQITENMQIPYHTLRERCENLRKTVHQKKIKLKKTNRQIIQTNNALNDLDKKNQNEIYQLQLKCYEEIKQLINNRLQTKEPTTNHNRDQTPAHTNTVKEKKKLEENPFLGRRTTDLPHPLISFKTMDSDKKINRRRNIASTTDNSHKKLLDLEIKIKEILKKDSDLSLLGNKGIRDSDLTFPKQVLGERPPEKATPKYSQAYRKAYETIKNIGINVVRMIKALIDITLRTDVTTVPRVPASETSEDWHPFN